MAFAVAVFSLFVVTIEAGTGKTVRVGYFSEAGMMNGVGEDETKSGYAYEYLQEIASIAGWKYEYVYGSFSDLYVQLQNGEIDILPYITKTEERSEQFLFPDKQMGDEQFYLASKTSGQLSADLKELSGKRVGTTRDAFQNIPFQEIIEARGIQCELVEFPGPDERWTALAGGAIDYSIETDTIFASIELHPVYELGTRYPYYLMLAAGREELLGELNAAQKHLDEVNPSFLSNLRYKYFKNIPLYREITDEGRKWLESHDSIRVGTFLDNGSYVIMNRDGSVSGIAPDYTRIMLDALDIDIPVNWKYYKNKNEAIAALKDGEIDLVNPYYHNYNDAEEDGIILSNQVYSADMSILYKDEYTDKTLSVIATPNTRLGMSYVRDNYPKSQVVGCATDENCVELLKSGKVSCVVMYTDSLNRLLKSLNHHYNMRSLNAHCQVGFAALPENSALISIIDKAAPYLSDVQMNAILDKYSVEQSNEITLRALINDRPELVVFLVALLFILVIIAILFFQKREKLSEQRRKENELFRNLIRQFTNTYEAVIIGNIADDMFKCISQKSTDFNLMDDSGLLSSVFDQFVLQDLCPADYEKVNSEMVHYAEIRKKLKAGESSNLVYRRKIGNTYRWHRSTLNRINEDEIIVGFKDCDDEIRSEMVKEKLISEYDALYVVDLNCDIITSDKLSVVSPIGAFSGSRTYSEVARSFAQTVAGQYRDDMLLLCDPEYLKTYMKDENHREYVYELPGIEHTMRRLRIDTLERENGVASVVLMSFMNIDEARAQAIALQKKMADQKVLLDYFVDSFNSAYFVNLEDDTYEVVYMNPEMTGRFAMTGEDREAMHNFINLHIHPNDRAFMFRMIDKNYVSERLREEPSYTFTVREINGDITKTMRCIIIRVADEYHIAVGFIDITEELCKEKEAQQRLKEALAMAESANKAKTTFLNSMSHDIRTPMNAIIGFTKLALMHLEDGEQVENYLDKISQAGNHLLSLINDILDMSRIESGKMSFREQPEDVLEIIRGLSDIIQPELLEKQHTLTVDTDAVSRSGIVCDKLRLNQVLLNILSNSIKYTPDGGVITLTVTEQVSKDEGKATFTFRITDNGMGMDEKYLKTIYEPFTRVRTSTISGIEGTGLGMAITKSIVDMMNGHIHVKSVVGKGTEVTVTFDFRLSDGRAAGVDPVDSQSLDTQDTSLEGKKILLVEDNPLNCEIATELLKEYGCSTDVAGDGSVAVEKIRNARPGDYDLILMDVQMPGMDGYEATRQIRALGTEVSQLPILAMTANAFEEDRQLAIEAGMNAHIPKPISVDSLRSFLLQYLK